MALTSKAIRTDALAAAAQVFAPQRNCAATTTALGWISSPTIRLGASDSLRD